MVNIVVLGGTGYAGGNIVAAAAAAGHAVVSYSRTAPTVPVAGVEYRTGDVASEATLAAAVDDADVVVSALAPRGDLSGPGVLRAIEATVARLAAARGVRFGVVGGAGSLLVTEDGPKLVDTADFPEEYREEARELDGVLEDLRGGAQDLDWFFVSPAAAFGGVNPGVPTGSYRIGGDILLVDEEGSSFVSGADFAQAVVAEIEEPVHRRSRFSVAY